VTPDSPDDERIVPVPERCRSAHGVFTHRPVDGSADFPAPAGALLRRFGADEDAVARLAERPHVRMFVTDVPLDAARDAAGQARRDAAAFADEHDGVLVDLAVPRIVEDATATGAAAWVGIDVDPLGLTTRGLEAFGLPELRLDGVDTSDAAPSIALMLGVAQRLLTEWPTHDPVGPAAITLHDIALAYGDPGDARAESGRRCDLLIALHDGELVLTVLGDPATDLFT
jgi:hypothetical protein